MVRYVIRRVLISIPQLILISLILFFMMQAIGDPLAVRGVPASQRQTPDDVERLRRQYGLDKPILVQYLVWLAGNDWMRIDSDGDGTADKKGAQKGILRGDLGNSLVDFRPASAVIAERIPRTLLLMSVAEVLTLSIALLIGIYSALKQYSVLDYFFTTVLFVGYSMPVVLLALLLLHVFAVRFAQWGLPHLPVIGTCARGVSCLPWQIARDMVLPVATLALIGIAEYSRYIRSGMLEVLNEDYVRSAQAKGVCRRHVVTRHALRNALLPLVTLVGMELPFLLGGALVVESIFSWPGMGRLFVERLEKSDYPVIMGILMLITVAVVLFQLLTDILYTRLDPRIRIEEDESAWVK